MILAAIRSNSAGNAADIVGVTKASKNEDLDEVEEEEEEEEDEEVSADESNTIQSHLESKRLKMSLSLFTTSTIYVKKVSFTDMLCPSLKSCTFHQLLFLI